MRRARIPLLLFSLSLAAAASPLFTITDLGLLGGSTGSAYSINSAGQVAGAYQPSGLALRAFSYSGGVFQDIAPPFASQSMARGINDQGDIAGVSYVGGRAQATVWDGGVATTLGDLGGGESYGNAINAGGMVVGMAVNGAGEGRPFAYAGGVMRDLGLPDGAVWASAYDVNGNGELAGYSMNSWGRFSAFVWSEEDGYVALGTLGGRNSYAMALNDSGDVVGNSLTKAGYAHAFLYTDGAMQDLGTLGGNASYAYDVNSSGAVVGYSLLADGLTHAFLYDGGIMLDLNGLLSCEPGWELAQAYGINDAGQIVGSGTLNGREHAFLLDPVIAASSLALGSTLAAAPVPEPGSGVLLAIGLCAALFLHYRASNGR
jgi:probable HAF family extracellular repeat protein